MPSKSGLIVRSVSLLTSLFGQKSFRLASTMSASSTRGTGECCCGVLRVFVFFGSVYFLHVSSSDSGQETVAMEHCDVGCQRNVW